MIKFYYWTTSNGHKITIFLEESGVPYSILPVDISKGEQFAPEFLKISPNNRIPAIVDTAPADGGDPISIFESGAILEYLADKTGLFLPPSARKRSAVLQWLYWQVGGLGPMIGQYYHFNVYAREKIAYAIDRYANETNRLFGVLEHALVGRDYVAGDYSIADMACFPWTDSYRRQGNSLSEFPSVSRWHERIASRPAVQRALSRARDVNEKPTVTEASREILFGQVARPVER